MDNGLKALISLVVSRGDVAELLQVTEEILDQMAPTVHGEVTCNRPHPIRFRRDDRDGTASIQLLAQRIIVEALVGNQCANLGPVAQRLSPDTVMALTRQKQEVRQVAERIHQGHDLGGRAAVRASDRLTPSPPLKHRTVKRTDIRQP